MARDADATNETWTFDYSTKKWDHRQQFGTPPDPTAAIAIACAYDPISQNVFMVNRNTIRKYNYNTSTWSLLTDLPPTQAYAEKAAVIVPNRNVFFILATANFYGYDIANNSFQNWPFPAEQAAAMGKCTGLEYDPKAEQLLALDNLGIWSLDLNTKIWTAKNKTGIPTDLGTDGPFGRWRYLPEYNVFMLVSSAKKNVLFYKNTAGSGPGSLSKENFSNPDSTQLTIFSVLGSDEITISNKQNISIQEVTIYDTLGKTILSKKGGDRMNDEMKFKVPNNGLYFVEVITEKNKWIKKILIGTN